MPAFRTQGILVKLACLLSYDELLRLKTSSYFKILCFKPVFSSWSFHTPFRMGIKPARTSLPGLVQSADTFVFEHIKGV